MCICRALCAGLFVCALSIGGTRLAAADPLDVNLLDNPGFEQDLNHWLYASGHATIRTASPPAHAGGKYLMAGHAGLGDTTTWQTIRLLAEGFSSTLLDAGTHTVAFGGWQSGWNTQQDAGSIKLQMLDGTGAELGSAQTDFFTSNHTWTLREDSIALAAGTRFLRYSFIGRHAEGGNLDAYLDAAYVHVTASPVPEPASLALMGLGLAGFAAHRRQRRRR